MHYRVNRTYVLISFLIGLLGAIGCRPDPSQERVENAPQIQSGSLAAMQAAANDGKWDEAFACSNEVLLQHPGNADVMSQVARVAYFAKKPRFAAELLRDACITESFQNESRGLQAVVALIGVGQLYDGIEMLEQAVAVQPMHFELRRWLFDFYIGTEDRLAAFPHAEYLIRHRKFDAELLVSLASMPRRSYDWTPLDQMVERNPDDQRPRLGRAKKLFDQGKFDESIGLLDQILKRHPDSMVTNALKARVLAASSQFDAVSELVSQVPDGTERYPDFWLAMGDLARSEGAPGEAARAYWESTRCDPNVTEAWSKLANVLVAAKDFSSVISDDVDAAAERAKKLNQLDRLVERFDQLGRESSEQAIDVAKSLSGLGRLWEAEAWAALAMTLKGPALVPTNQTRESIIAVMSKGTPWQVSIGQPALQLDLTMLPLPSKSRGGIVNKPGAMQSKTSIGYAAQTNPSPIMLTDEAAQRGLNFFGRTRRDPENLNTMLHETLGCGGGVIDYDHDGWPDLYLLAAGGTPPHADSSPNALMRNLSGRFLETTIQAAVGDTGFGQGVAVGDINEDGFADLLVLNFGRNTLYINNGDGTFKDATKKLGANSDKQWSTSGAIADIDGDGISDAIVLNYCVGDDIATFGCGNDHGFTRSCTPVVYPADNDLFYRTNEIGDLVDQTFLWNAVPEISGRGLGIVAGSLDEQPGLDLYVVNDQTENHFWSLQKSNDAVRLAESGIARGLASNDRSLAQGSMGIASGDFDLDQDIDFYVTNFSGEYSTYYEQQIPGSWKDSTAQKGLVAPTLPMVGFGTAAVDLDNDGLLELMVTNGNVDIFVFDEVTKQPTIQSQPAQLFHLDSSGGYRVAETAAESGYMQRPHFGRALWTFDVDRDGRIDMGVTHQTEPIAILVNHTAQTHHWIEFQLVGVSSARDAVGAKIELQNDTSRCTGWLTSGDGFLCSSERIVRFGLGATVQPCGVTITWPDGSIQTIDHLSVDSRWLIVQHEDGYLVQ